MFYDTLLELFTESSNFKVRINACIALMTVNIYDRSSIGLKSRKETATTGKYNESIYIELWMSLVSVFSKLNSGEQSDDDEVQHKATLIHQVNSPLNKKKS